MGDTMPRQELFATINNPTAEYAVDLITRLVKAMEPHIEYDLKSRIGEDLHSEVCHAIGWDIDWEAIHNRDGG